MFDPIGWLTSMVPILVLVGISVLVMTLVHLGLSISGNRFSTEISAVLGLAVFIVGEFVLGIADPTWILIMLVLVTPMVVYEAVKPSSGDSGPPVLLDTGLSDTLCFSLGRIFLSMSAIKITGIPFTNESTNNDESDDLKLLHPLWDDSHKSGTTFSVEAKIQSGLVELVVFIISADKNSQGSIERAQHSRVVAETWLNQMNYSFEVLVKQSLEDAYSEIERDYHDSKTLLSIDGLPNRLSNNYGVLIQRLSEKKLNSRIQFSFTSGVQPRLKRDTGVGNAEDQSRTPYRVEDHQLRSIYRQMAEIEACEETGVFRASISILGERGNMNQIESIVRSVWSSVKTVVSQSLQRNWNRLLLRSQVRGRTSVSGAKLLALLDLSGTVPGISNRVVTPEFYLPLLDSTKEDSISFGKVLHRGNLLDQTYDIPIDRFCFHTGIYGTTGSGKSNTVKQLLHEFDSHGIPFLVIDPSTTGMRQLCEDNADLRVFTVGDENTAPFRYNPFDVPPGVPISKHIDGLVTCFTAAWPTEGILVEHIAKVFRRVYSMTGWDVLENKRGRPILLSDLHRAMEMVVSELEYGSKLNQDFVGALKARFGSIMEDPQVAVILNTLRGLKIPELLSQPTVVELKSLPSSKANLISSLLLVGISEYLGAQLKFVEQRLKHILVIEEASHLLKRINTGGGIYESHASQQQSINSIVALLREARGYGLGIILLDQLPGELADAAVKLPGITIIHYLKEPRERVIVGGQANLNDEQLLHIGALEVGEAIVH
ncbi:MAG: ATP-binding protein, partial [Candidatus Thorarchaeota archaeon]